MSAHGRIVAVAGPVSVTVIGSSVTAVSIATVLVAAGGAAALGLAGYGVYRYLSSGGSPEQVADKKPIVAIATPTESGSLVPSSTGKKTWWKVWE